MNNKKGRNYYCICPFHKDNSPSMSISEEKQIYKCFVCGATGNVFTFMKDYNNTSFEEAVSIIEEKIDDVQKTFKKFKPESKKTVDLIKLRLSEGYTLDDFFKVIDKMTHCWLSNGRLEEYLRPITLFGDKFEEYLEGNWERNEVDWSSQYYETVY